MNQHIEDRLPDAQAAAAAPAGARILPFERPQSDLQRAIQRRAQDALDRDRERDREDRRPQPLKWLTILAVASIPVVLTFGAVDGFLRAFYKVTEVINASAPPAPAPADQAPVSSTPGVVMLQSYEEPAAGSSRAAPAPPAAASRPSADQP